MTLYRTPNGLNTNKLFFNKFERQNGNYHLFVSERAIVVFTKIFLG